VTTVLGSCVAVTFFSAQLGLGAICHAMLPAPKGGDDPTLLGEKRWKFVCYAIDELIRCFQQPGVPPSAVEVKIFGGGHLLQRPTAESRGLTVGSANVALARRLLAEAGFEIVAGDVGGPLGRKVVFNTKTGSVHVKSLGGSNLAP
jgi:chemotaxis protein CheD